MTTIRRPRRTHPRRSTVAAPGNRISYTFWNKTRDGLPPVVHYGLVLSTGRGISRVKWEDGGHITTIPAYALRAADAPELPAYDPTHHERHAAHQRARDRARGVRYFTEDWEAEKAQRERENAAWPINPDLAERVAVYKKQRAAARWRATMLTTPYTFPPACPVTSCGRPVYPRDDEHLAGFVCREHGDVTNRVLGTYYAPTSPFDVGCPTCGATGGLACRTASGKWRETMHDRRPLLTPQGEITTRKAS